nr:hypothetical protein [Chenggangzhangella methanolivorans]
MSAAAIALFPMASRSIGSRMAAEAAAVARIVTPSAGAIRRIRRS